MTTIDREFFEQLGNLFYSLAVDRSVKPIEYSELKLLISKNWMTHPQDSDLPVPENVHFIFFTIDTLLTTNVSTEEAYNDFANYYSSNENLFTGELVDKILETAKELSSLFPLRTDGNRDHFRDLLTLLTAKEKST